MVAVVNVEPQIVVLVVRVRVRGQPFFATLKLNSYIVKVKHPAL